MAYGAKGERNGLHVDGKKQHKYWCFDEAWRGIQAAAADLGEDVTGMIVGIGEGRYKVARAKGASVKTKEGV